MGQPGSLLHSASGLLRLQREHPFVHLDGFIEARMSETQLRPDEPHPRCVLDLSTHRPRHNRARGLMPAVASNALDWRRRFREEERRTQTRPQPDLAKREPSLFISHKHADKKIADVIREFIYQRTNREVAVFQSSAADADAPELGHALAGDLRDALWQTGVVILVYTTEDQDWQWCMWGVWRCSEPGQP